METQTITCIDFDFIDDNNVTHFDGYTIDEDETGLVMAYGINGEVYYCCPDYRYLEVMKDAVSDYKLRYLNDEKKNNYGNNS